jgi:hypothetical protein
LPKEKRGLFSNPYNKKYYGESRGMKMENIVESLCKQGTISFEFLERGYSVIFEPHFKNTLPEQLQSTIIIVRNNLLETVEALDHYITVEKHWTEFPDAFWID